MACNLLQKTFRQVRVDQVRGLVEKGAFIGDVRDEESYRMGQIKTAVNIPIGQIRQRMEEIPKDRPVYLYCKTGQTSYNAVLALQGHGYHNIYNSNFAHRFCLCTLKIQYLAGIRLSKFHFLPYAA